MRNAECQVGCPQNEVTEIGVSGDTMMLVVFVTFFSKVWSPEEQVRSKGRNDENFAVFAVFGGEYGVKFCSV